MYDGEDMSQLSDHAFNWKACIFIMGFSLHRTSMLITAPCLQSHLLLPTCVVSFASTFFCMIFYLQNSPALKSKELAYLLQTLEAFLFLTLLLRPNYAFDGCSCFDTRLLFWHRCEGCWQMIQIWLYIWHSHLLKSFYNLFIESVLCIVYIFWHFKFSLISKFGFQDTFVVCISKCILHKSPEEFYWIKGWLP